MITSFRTYSSTKLVECSARTNENIRDVFKTFLFLSKIAPNISGSSKTSSRRTSEEEAKLNLHNHSMNETTPTFPRSDEIILTSSYQKSPFNRSRWGSLKSRSNSPNLVSSPGASPLRRNMSAYGRPGQFSKRGENEEPKDLVRKNNRLRPNSGNKTNGVGTLEVHFEKVYCIFFLMKLWLGIFRCPMKFYSLNLRFCSKLSYIKYETVS